MTSSAHLVVPSHTLTAGNLGSDSSLGAAFTDGTDDDDVHSLFRYCTSKTPAFLASSRRSGGGVKSVPLAFEIESTPVHVGSAAAAAVYIKTPAIDAQMTENLG